VSGKFRTQLARLPEIANGILPRSGEDLMKLFTDVLDALYQDTLNLLSSFEVQFDHPPCRIPANNSQTSWFRSGSIDKKRSTSSPSAQISLKGSPR
jgi:hypothetical protein